MPAKNTEKKSDSIRELNKNISPILVINNSSLKPYIELFEYAPENIYQKPLGSLVGFFEIKEYSEESAYVVNFLTSVLKKEYYTNPRRSVAESFDSAMNKVNLALSEVAKHGNVDWIGKLHACICVIEKNSIHFTVAGNAMIFLNRKKILTEISEGLSSNESQPHPLKTFINVSSGRLEKEDRLIITCEDIFHILKLSDLKKNLERLTKEQFVQFLKTALSNELEMIATIVTDFEEAKKTPTAKKIADEESEFQEETINVFSKTAFPEKTSISEPIELSNQVSEIPAVADYTDKKTGHIYVQGGALPEETSQVQHYWELIAEKISDGWHLTKSSTSRKYSLYKKRLEKKIKQAKINAELKKQQRLAEREVMEAEFLMQQEAEELQEKISEELIQQQQISTLPNPIVKRQLNEIINLKEKANSTKDSLKKSTEGVDEKISSHSNYYQAFNAKLSEIQKQKSNPDSNFHEITNTLKLQDSPEKKRISPNLAEKAKPFLKKINTATLSGLNSLKNTKEPILKVANDILKKTKSNKSNFKDLKIVPHLSRLKKLYRSLNSKQKISVFLALIIIFVVPIFISNWLNKPKPVVIKDLPVIPISQISKLANEKNISFNNEATNLLSNTDLDSVLVADSSIITSTHKNLIILKNGQKFEYPFPSNTGNATTLTYMPAISTVLILTDQNKLLSFTPSNSKFSENNIQLPVTSVINHIGTYLTYLYIIDPISNQVARYPRADGGFGEKINWLKDNATLNGISDMTIDDSIYVVQNNQIVKFLKGKQTPMTLEDSKTPVHFDKIFTSIDSPFLYALDTQNSRLVQYDKTTGTITAQLFNDALKDTTSFTVDEKNKAAYITTSTGLITMAIQ